MKEVLLGLLMLAVFLFGYFIVDNIGRYFDKHYR